MRGEEKPATVVTKKHLHNRHRKRSRTAKVACSMEQVRVMGGELCSGAGRRPVSELTRTTHRSICALTQLTAVATTKPHHAELLVKKTRGRDGEETAVVKRGERKSTHSSGGEGRRRDQKAPPTSVGVWGGGEGRGSPHRPDHRGPDDARAAQLFSPGGNLNAPRPIRPS